VPFVWAVLIVSFVLFVFVNSIVGSVSRISVGNSVLEKLRKDVVG